MKEEVVICKRAGTSSRERNKCRVYGRGVEEEGKCFVFTSVYGNGALTQCAWLTHRGSDKWEVLIPPEEEK